MLDRVERRRRLGCGGLLALFLFLFCFGLGDVLVRGRILLPPLFLETEAEREENALALERRRLRLERRAVRPQPGR